MIGFGLRKVSGHQAQCKRIQCILEWSTLHAQEQDARICDNVGDGS